MTESLECFCYVRKAAKLSHVNPLILLDTSSAGIRSIVGPMTAQQYEPQLA